MLCQQPSRPGLGRDRWLVNACQDFTILLGDDVTIQTRQWLDRVEVAYQCLAVEVFESPRDQERFYGFGCVAFTDVGCPNFPSFPVVSRLHWEAFDRRVFPEEFVNQDADPFLFALYARFDAARLDPRLVLTNAIGGHRGARYEKVGMGGRRQPST
jgi:hypothetical protein